ncbi:MAG: hypothetical protein P1V36_01750 [Planctomycetota bacterium]|nr:hypothetical protein [Planctomycetota bacterium]
MTEEEINEIERFLAAHGARQARMITLGKQSQAETIRTLRHIANGNIKWARASWARAEALTQEVTVMQALVAADIAEVMSTAVRSAAVIAAALEGEE